MRFKSALNKSQTIFSKSSEGHDNSSKNNDKPKEKRSSDASTAKTRSKRHLDELEVDNGKSKRTSSAPVDLKRVKPSPPRYALF